MKVNRLMLVEFGDKQDPAKLYFNIADLVEVQDAFKKAKEAKDENVVLNPLMEYIFSNLVKVENLYDGDKPITKDDLIAGKLPSYIYSLIRTGYFAQINSAENAEKKDFMSV